MHINLCNTKSQIMISLFLVIHFPVSRARIHVYNVFGMREIDLGRSLDIAGQAISSTPTTSSNADEHELSFTLTSGFFMFTDKLLTGTKSVPGKQHNDFMVCAQGVARNFLQVCETHTERTHK